jgi:hypothetical protein
LDNFEWQWHGVEFSVAFWTAGNVEAGETQDLLSGAFGLFIFRRFRRRGLADGVADGFEGFFSVGVGEEPEEADFMEAGREDVEREATNKLMGIEGDGVDLFLFAVFRTEGDLAVFDVFDAMVVDGDAVGVAAEVVKYLCGSAEGALRIDGPSFLFGGVEQSMEGGRVGERRELSMEAEAPDVEEAEQSVAIVNRASPYFLRKLSALRFGAAKTRLSARTGKRKLGCWARMNSFALRTPAGMMTCRWK